MIWGLVTNQAQAKLARTGEVIKTANVDVVPAEPRLRLRKLVSNSVYTWLVSHLNTPLIFKIMIVMVM